MLRNNLKIAARHLWNQKGYTILNAGGLAVGMATCLLIGLYIQDELSYDDFHPQADRIQVMTIGDSTNRRTNTPYPLGQAIAHEVPGVARVTQTQEVYERPVRLDADGRRMERTQQVLRADSAFFRVFNGFPLRRGARASVLDGPNEAVITKSMARRFFGDRDPIGHPLTVEGDTVREYTVVGVTTVPSNSTIQFDMVVSWHSVSPALRTSWRDFTSHTYVRSKEGRSPQRLGTAATRATPLKTLDRDYYVSSISLPDYYLSDEYRTGGFRGQVRYLYIFGTVALLVLLIAVINYVNLVTAQSQQRIREVGVRKAMGARRGQLARQFFVETLLLSGLALVVALVLVNVSIPAFNALFDKSLSLSTMRHGRALASSVGVVLGGTLLGGAYPALVLSRFRPARILRGASSTTVGQGGWLRKGLVVAQFAVSAGLIFGTTTLYQQLNYVQTKDLGFDDEQVVTVNLDELDQEQRQLVRRRVRRAPTVQAASIGSRAPGGSSRMVVPNAPSSFSPQARSSDESLLLRPIQVDTNYVETLGLHVLAGRSFAASDPVERGRGYILNQAAVAAMGWTEEEAVGKSFRLVPGSEKARGTVIGVVENFHTSSLRSPIAPVVLALELAFSPSESMLATRLSPGDISAGMDHLRGVVAAVAPQVDFTYTFLDEKFDAMYRSERQLARIFAVFAMIAIVVACMGLFGLAAFSAERRTREIGVRKALGASVRHVVGLFSKEYAVLLAGALLVGLPLGYLSVRRWLQVFAYRVEVGAETFVFTAVVVLCIAGAAVGYHAIQAARTDPARALRDE
jgi:putative ABC transport system permease protein